MAQWADQGQDIDGSCPCGRHLSAIHPVLEDFSIFLGMVRLTKNKGRGHRLYREEELVPPVPWAPEESLVLRTCGKVWMIGQRVSEKASFLIWPLTDTYPQPCPLQSTAWTL